MPDYAKIPSESALKAILQDVRMETGVPGIGVAIGIRGRTLAVAAGASSLNSGAALTTSSRFEMSCLMKFFVSLVVLDLAGSGELDLDTPLAKFFPELKSDSGEKSEKIALHHLLSHTSGYRGLDITDMKVRWNYAWDRFVVHFLTFPPSFSAGSTFNYEHSEHVILGEILHRVTGQRARDLVWERILNPLGIETGSARSDKEDPARFVANHAFSPSTGTFSAVSIPPFGTFWDASLPDCTITLHDVICIANALLQNGNEKTVFSPSVLAQLISPIIVLPQGIHSDRQSEQIPRSFGRGCAQYNDTMLGHNGSMLGQTCALRFDPQMGAAVIVGVNARSTFARDAALQRIWAAIANQPVSCQHEPAKRIFRLDEILSDFTFDQVSGRYVGSYLGEVNVTKDANRLRFDVGPPGNRRISFQIVPADTDDGDAYRIESQFPVSVIFSRDAASNGPSLFLGVHSYKKIF